jgi:hypothetical protein
LEMWKCLIITCTVILSTDWRGGRAYIQVNNRQVKDTFHSTS